MKEQLIISKIKQLPEESQLQIMNFIEFLLQQYNKSATQSKKPIFGSLKGSFKMSEDFDAPLEDFKDYM